MLADVFAGRKIGRSDQQGFGRFVARILRLKPLVTEFEGSADVQVVVGWLVASCFELQQGQGSGFQFVEVGCWLAVGVEVTACDVKGQG